MTEIELAAQREEAEANLEQQIESLPEYDGASPDETDPFWKAIHDLYMAAHGIGDLAADLRKDKTRRRKYQAEGRRCVRELAALCGVRQDDDLFKKRLSKLLD